MGLLVKKFLDNASSAVAGLHVVLTDIKYGNRIKYKLLGRPQSFDEDLITNATGFIVADVLADTFIMSAYNRDNVLIYRDVITPVVNTLGYTADLAANVVIEIIPTVLALNFVTNGAAQTLRLQFRQSDGTYLTALTGVTLTQTGDACATPSYNATTGVLTLTPVTDATGVKILTYTAPNALTVVITVTVAAAP